MSRPQKIVLVAGQECLISCLGSISITLLEGVVEVAGLMLAPRVEYTFRLSSPHNRRLSMYTFEGGSVTVTSAATIDFIKYATDAGAFLNQHVRNNLAPLRGARVAVVGHSGSGKTLTAHTICNLLSRSTGVPSPPPVFLCDLNPQSNSVYAPGCISCVEVSGAHPLLVGDAAAPELPVVSFFLGSATPPTSVPFYLHFMNQLQEGVQGMVKTLTGSKKDAFVVYDVPAPSKETPLDTFLKRVLELIRPTHIIALTYTAKRGPGTTDDSASRWYSGLEEGILRLLPDCDFRAMSHVPHSIVVSSASGSSSQQQLQNNCAHGARQLLYEEYFVGSVDHPLGCTKIVCPISSLQFYQLSLSKDASSSNVIASRITPTREDVVSYVCAVSHAAIEAEVPFANICGLILIVDMHVDHDELVALVPAGDDVPIPRPFIIVPNRWQSEENRGQQHAQPLSLQVRVSSTVQAACL